MTEVVQVKREDLHFLLNILRDAQDVLDLHTVGKSVNAPEHFCLKRLEGGEALVRHVMSTNLAEEFNGPFCAACGRLRND